MLSLLSRRPRVRRLVSRRMWEPRRLNEAKKAGAGARTKAGAKKAGVAAALPPKAGQALGRARCTTYSYNLDIVKNGVDFFKIRNLQRQKIDSLFLQFVNCIGVSGN